MSETRDEIYKELAIKVKQETDNGNKDAWKSVMNLSNILDDKFCYRLNFFYWYSPLRLEDISYAFFFKSTGEMLKSIVPVYYNLTCNKCSHQEQVLINLRHELERRKNQSWMCTDCSRKALIDYPKYLETPHWRYFRELALEHFNNQCLLCNTTENINVHHKDYARLGREKLSDVVTLCQSCHGLWHKVLDEQKSRSHSNTSQNNR